MFETVTALRQSAHQILSHAQHYEWSLQGLGMLRLYLSREYRLHVWDRRFVVADASEIHTHPWSFDSLVLSGEVRQFRYTDEGTRGQRLPSTRAYKRLQIKCGPVGCAVAEPEPTWLARSTIETYSAGETYRQNAEEIHESFPVSGTVTLVQRTFHEDTEHAYVYFDGAEWGEATPRPATPEEVESIVGLALRRWGR